MTPDLATRIYSAALTSDRVRSLLEASKGVGGLLPIFTTSRRTLRGREFEPLLDFATFHDYLGDEADWDAPTWIFEPEGLRQLRSTIEWLFIQIPETFSFEAIWVSDRIEEERQVSRKELLELIASDQIGTKTRYWVAGESDQLH